ncbi:TonB C-terminal domain-containing protein [Massilia sp. P8910]|uniref:TonB C-terminal domain-containing protein n=1 Tax=Massilia antarctica TaxID=2765360 RepID=UPI001E427947|nr:TonB C-terminal domain-containing protein [Massilia antarctica]MCE3608209.1 TonB C-terminal domain-containing protein [Massilia antarctica]
MPHIPPYLARLGLDQNADERAIRRAYARQLKQIDQETESDRFQLLRTDYESSLAWLAWASHHDDDDDDDDDDGAIEDTFNDTSGSAGANRADAGGERPAEQTPEPQPAPTPSYSPPQAPVAVNIASHQTNADAQPPTRDAGLGSDPEQLAGDVFQQFLKALTRLRAGRMLHDEALWADELQRCLNDERLLNIAARMGFEARIAYFLAGARQRGHETLFFAAMSVFGWISDRHRLEKFGHPGAIVNRAIDEQNMFHAQGQVDRTRQQEVLAGLRKPTLPRHGELRRLMPYLQTMLARFPVLMRFIADEAAVSRWHEAYAGLTAKNSAPLPVKESEWEAAAETEKSSRSYAWIIGVMIVLSTLFNAMKSSPPRAPIAPRPMVESVRPALPRGEPLTRAQLDEIDSRIDYKVGKDATPGLRSAKFEVLLDAEGKVKSLTMLDESGDQRYTDAVGKAIRESRPFPASVRRHFLLTFSVRLTRTPRRREFVPPPLPVFGSAKRKFGEMENKPRPAPPSDEAHDAPPGTQ